MTRNNLYTMNKGRIMLLVRSVIVVIISIIMQSAAYAKLPIALSCTTLGNGTFKPVAVFSANNPVQLISQISPIYLGYLQQNQSNECVIQWIEHLDNGQLVGRTVPIGWMCIMHDSSGNYWKGMGRTVALATFNANFLCHQASSNDCSLSSCNILIPDIQEIIIDTNIISTNQ